MMTRVSKVGKYLLDSGILREGLSKPEISSALLLALKKSNYSLTSRGEISAVLGACRQAINHCTKMEGAPSPTTLAGENGGPC